MCTHATLTYCKCLYPVFSCLNVVPGLPTTLTIEEKCSKIIVERNYLSPLTIMDYMQTHSASVI